MTTLILLAALTQCPGGVCPRPTAPVAPVYGGIVIVPRPVVHPAYDARRPRLFLRLFAPHGYVVTPPTVRTCPGGRCGR